MTLYELRQVRNKILDIAHAYGIKNIRVFGSVARGETGPNSDLDLIVDIEDGRSLFDLIGFKQDVEDLLNVKVDVGTTCSLKKAIKEAVLREAVEL